MAEKRMTKKEMYEVIKGLVAGDESVQAAEVREFCTAQIASLDKISAQRAAKRAEKAAAEPDELCEVIQSILTDEYQTVAQIMSQIEGDGLTSPKVVARCTKLVKAGIAERSEVKIEGESRKKVAYKLA